MNFFSFRKRPKDKERKMPDLDKLQKSVNKITSITNGVDGAFIIDLAEGVFCTSNVAGGGSSAGVIDFAEIGRWATAHTISDAGNELNQLIGGNGFKCVDYTFTDKIVRLFYVLNRFGQHWVVGFVCSNPQKTGGPFRSSSIAGIAEITPLLD